MDIGFNDDFSLETLKVATEENIERNKYRNTGKRIMMK